MKVGHPEGIHYITCGRCHRRNIDILQVMPPPDLNAQPDYAVVCLDCDYSARHPDYIEAIDTFEKKLGGVDLDLY